MADIPQPSPDPYAVGDRVKIYLDSADPDTRHHGEICEVLEVLTDDLDAETERELDKYSYKLQPVDSKEALQITFRHYDLVPADAVR
jgi:hypothetical protein